MLINNVITNIKNANVKEINYQVYSVNGNYAQTLITFQSESGIDKIKYLNKDAKEIVLNANGKTDVSIDYEMQELNTYSFDVTYINGETKTLTINFELPRIQGNYTLKNGIYVDEPDISTGFNKNVTRYIYLDDNKNLVPGNWLNDTEPSNWYDYKSKNWANVFVENEGAGTYYVWIPRYCYKIKDSTQSDINKRMDIKFINVYNQYIDAETGNKLEWSELQAQGYTLPEAFTWNPQFNDHIIANSKFGEDIPGYWISKYQLSDLNSYIINYSAVSNASSIKVKNLKTNTSEDISTYTYAINGKIVHTSSSPDIYTFENIENSNQLINITALNQDGEIIGSMTKTADIIKVNEPDIRKFNPDITYYVYYTKDDFGNEIEQSDIPITDAPPSNWYDYSTSNWANVVVKQNGESSYFVWIPRYQYRTDSISSPAKTIVKFIDGTGTDTESGYTIPEAFWWDNNGNGKQDDGEQLKGYWISKYQLEEK